MPAPLLGSLLEQIDDLAELKCTLRVVALLNEKRGHPRFVTLRELQTDPCLTRAVGQTDGGPVAGHIESALKRAVRRGTLAFAIVGKGGRRQPIFGLNSETDRRALARLSEEGLPASPEDPVAGRRLPERLNIFALYEQNIGMLSPLISDELREAEGLYPEDWIEDAIKEAVANNRRSWRYISRILDRWEREGRGHGESGRHSKTTARF